MDIRARHEWGARAPKRAPIIIPADRRSGLVVHHNGPYMRLDTSLPHAQQVAAETRKARALQRFHQDSLGWSDGAYSYYLGQSGTLFDCRGLEWDQFANGDDVVGDDDGPDRKWYSVMAMIGWNPKTGDEEQPTDAMLEALVELVAFLRSEGAGDRVLPHNNFKVKRCPGKVLTAAAARLDGTAIEPGEPMYGIENESAEARSTMRAGLAGSSTSHDIWLAGQRALNGLDDRGLIDLPEQLTVDGIPGPKTGDAWRTFEIAKGYSNVDELPGSKSWPTFWDWVYEKPSPTNPKVVRDRAVAIAALRTIESEADTALDAIGGQ
ncbi:MAG: N-acetylmuramoyl-L-alanine amidase [Gammaproteobacteria bacterium]|nr:N-acetylmuramoyl-L-alanine amidase [Gammaproteobacteria bacterium]